MKHNRRTAEYRRLLAKLPQWVHRLADETFELFLADPSHPSLRLHALVDTARGQHRSGSFAVYLGKKYRVIYHIDGDTNVWYWIGTHNDYENFTGKK